MNNILKKLTSRKLWMAIAGIATGVALALGADASDIQTVAGAVTALVSAVTYILTEGKVDAASVANTVQKAQDAKEVISNAD
jgi:drug/metabolite transporter (DMT)-like permease